MALSNRHKSLSLSLLLIATAACGGGGSGGTPSGPVDEIVVNPATNFFFVRELNNQGNGVTLNFADDPVWGRLVEIQAIDPATSQLRTYFKDYLIGENIVTGGSYDLTRNPITGEEVLTINEVFGTSAFESAFRRIEDGLQNFLDKGLGSNELPPFTSMPRNAAMALRFDDLLDADTISAATILLETGYPPSVPFQARIFADPNHGDMVGNTFHTTRVIIDMSVSQSEAALAGIVPNPIGLPEATDVNLPNAVIRIPTILNAAATQFELLTNLSDHAMGFGGNGNTLSTSPTLDVIRAFRSGGRSDNTGDSYNGFLRDDEPPQVLGSLGVQVTLIAPVGNEYDLTIMFNSLGCALTPRVGDLVVMSGGVTAQVITAGSPPGAFGTVSNVRCRLIAGDPIGFIPGIGEYRAPWDATVPVVPECFVRFSPNPQVLPATGVNTDASIQIGFNEPMLPVSLSSFDGIVVQKGAGGLQPFDNNVLAIVTPGLDLQDFTFEPQVPFDHDTGNQETYTIQLSPAVTDLAGNAIADSLPDTIFSLRSIAATENSGGFGFSFSAGVTGTATSNVDDNGDGLPELRGQFIFDPLRGEIRARSVDRFSGVIDDTRCSVLSMVPATQVTSAGLVSIPVGALEPLSAHGSRTMTMWRYYDMGLNLFDESTFNIDVEGLHWAPFTQGLSLDFFSEFSIGLAHSLYHPDQTADIPTFALQFFNSGLLPVFDANLLDPVNDPLTVVHQRTEGYLVQPLDQFQAPSGALLAPWPLNRSKPLSDFSYYTWRDTALTGLGGINSSGADPGFLALAMCEEDFNNFPVPNWVPGGAGYGGGVVPSIGLPLLMDFRNYPDSSAQGLNLLSYRFGAGLNFPQGLPIMRLHSTGAQLPTGTIMSVNPDNQVTASGSFDVSGAPTPGTDDGFYLGQVDFVVRVNRIHTIWLDAGAPSTWEPALLLPSTLDQPEGTDVFIDYRGADDVQSPDIGNADLYDPYGVVAGGVVFAFNGNSEWTSDVSELDGARFIQMRITLVSNAESGVEPVLSAVGLSYSN